MINAWKIGEIGKTSHSVMQTHVRIGWRLCHPQSAYRAQWADIQVPCWAEDMFCLLEPSYDLLVDLLAVSLSAELTEHHWGMCN